jgi:NADPH-dependent 2,4-dienoyl-CoA reductase/sulfur reductase-like enzyme
METISFDYLVICTGAMQRHPIKDAEVFTLEERKSRLAVE